MQPGMGRIIEFQPCLDFGAKEPFTRQDVSVKKQSQGRQEEVLSIGGVDENQAERARLAAGQPAGRIPFDQAPATAVHTQIFQIGTDEGRCVPGLLHEDRLARPPAQGFQAKGAAAGETRAWRRGIPAPAPWRAGTPAPRWCGCAFPGTLRR